MPRNAHLERHLSSEELRQRYRASQDAVESRRYHLLWLVSQGHSIKRASEMVTLSYRYARDVVKDYNQQAAYDIRNQRKERRCKGPPSLLSQAQLQELQEALRQPPQDKGKWTSRKVALWMSKELGREVAVQRGWDYLKKLDGVRRKPRPRHLKAGEQEQASFKKS